MTCDRCLRETFAIIGSMFNMQMICLDCKQAEEQRPDYEEARRVESEAVKSGDFNFPGIGLK